MAPLGEALRVTYAGAGTGLGEGEGESSGLSSRSTSAGQEAESDHDDGSSDVYTGIIDSEWCIGAVPQGGYVLGLIVDAAVAHQRRPGLQQSQGNGPSLSKQSAHDHHPDPIHVSAHFLRATRAFVFPDGGDGQAQDTKMKTNPAPFEVRLRTVKRGLTFTNLVGELVQDDKVNISAHLIFGSLSPQSGVNDKSTLTLLPPSPYARVTPLRTHPKDAAPLLDVRRPWRFKKYAELHEDPAILSRNQVNNSSPPPPGSATALRREEERQGLEWGAWLDMPYEAKGEGLRASMIPFMADTFRNLPQLIPRESEEGKGLDENSWYPTIYMSIEFKAPIPRSTKHSKTTVGLYSVGRFMQDPSGRHDAYVEVWTAPPPRESEAASAGWREEQRCVAVSSQMALVVPAEANRRVGRGRSSKL